MHWFEYRNGELFAEDVPLDRIAREVGTPFYCYSHRTLKQHYQVFDQSFKGVPHLVCFSVKSNSSLALLKLFLNEGAGMDVVSGGELFRVLKAGADPKKVVYAGVGKTPEELREALSAGILLFNVEGDQELQTLNRIAGDMGTRAPVAIRVNPDVDPDTHEFTTTGKKENKFGIHMGRSLEMYGLARSLEHIDPVGVHCHIGSQIVKSQPFVDALARVKDLVRALREDSFSIEYLDLGGGLGIMYDEEKPPHPSEYASALIREAGDLGCTFILEPGRVLVGNAGILVSRVQYVKQGPTKTFVIMDAGMNDCIRPSLYGAYQAIWPVAEKGGDKIPVDIVGPICESGDFLAKDRLLPPFEAGDLLAVMSAGAYGFTMASNYNSRPRPAEVLVKGDQYWTVRERERYDDLVRGESVPEFLEGG